MTTVTVPAESLFGLDNLPYGVYSVAGSEPRVAVRLGDTVVDLAGLLGDEVFARPSLNAFMAQGHERWVQVRAEIRDRLGRECRGRGGARRGALPALGGHPAPARARSPTTSTSTPPSTTPRTWAGSSGRRTPTRSRPTGSTCRSATTAVPARSWCRAPTSCGRQASARARRRPGARVRAEHPARHRGGAGLHRRDGVRARGAHPGGGGRAAPLRCGALQRLVGPRHPGVGVRPARAEPGQVVRLHDLALGGAAPGAAGGRRCPRRSRTRSRCPTSRPRSRGGWTSTSRSAWNGEVVTPAAVPRDVLVASTDARAPDRERRLDPHRRPVRLGHHLRAGEGHSAAPSSSSPGAGRSRSRWPARSAPSSRTGTRWC